MAKLLRLRRGTSTQHTTFTGAEGEVTVNTTNDSLHVHDGTTAGGTELAKADLSNVDGSLSNNLGFGDSVKATFGASNDLEIYHNGSHSVIADTGTGQLQVLTNQFRLNNAANNENLIACDQDGNVQVYNDGAVKFATTSTGIDVTGTVTCDGLVSETGDSTIRNATGRLILRDFADSGSASQQYISGLGADAAEDWYLGQTSNANPHVHMVNKQDGEIQFGTNDTFRHAISSAGHWIPQTTNAYDLGSGSNQFRDAYFDGTVNCDGLDVDGAADITVPSAAEATPLRLHNSTSGGNTRLLISSFANGSGDPFIKFDAGGTDMTVGLLWASGSNTLRLGPGTNPASVNGLQVDQDGHCLPTANNSFDLGASTLRWRNVYTNDLNLSNEGGTNDVDGTWGSWTIQEGEDDLFLLNRRNGKKYKFNLSEVN